MFIRVTDLYRSFGKNHVLRGINLSVEKGDSLVILGGSGAGKSVLLRHLIGLLHGDRGQVSIDGTLLIDLSRRQMYRFRRRFGMSFQEGALFDSLTAFENIAFPIRRQDRGMKESKLRKRVQECLEIVGMPTVGGLLPSELSGGMRRRVGFARAIALKPEILLFDEPTTGLDPIMTAVVDEVIISMRERLSATTITITHDIGSARRIATHVAMLFRGQVIYSDSNPNFFQSEHAIVRQFVEGRSQGPATEALFK